MGKVRKRKYIREDNMRYAKLHLLRQSTKCALCGDEITNLRDASVDHKIPISRGGTHALDNLQLAHKTCNEQKGSRLDGWDPPL